MTETRAEITLKFSGVMPSAKPAANKKVEIQLTDQNSLVFTALINAKGCVAKTDGGDRLGSSGLGSTSAYAQVQPF